MHGSTMNMMRKMMARFFGKRIFGIRMASCREVAELLSDYMENTLSDDERRSIDFHLKTCVDCRNYLETLKQTMTLLGQIPAVPMPSEFEEHLEALLRKRLLN